MSQSAPVALYDSVSARLSMLDTTSKLFTPPMPGNPMTFAHWLTVIVTSDNAPPCSATIYFETSIPTPTHKLSDPVAARLGEALPPDDEITDWEAVDLSHELHQLSAPERLLSHLCSLRLPDRPCLSSAFSQASRERPLYARRASI
jgi:hypothetical protein